MARLLLFVEGHGEVAAANNLVTRIWHDLGGHLPWAPALRWKNLQQKQGIERACAFARAQADVAGMLVLRDEDDRCPRSEGPTMAAWLAAEQLPFPSAAVLLHREYEVLFLPCLDRMAGQPLGDGAMRRPGLKPGVTWPYSSWEARRDIKGWLTENFTRGAYKPTLDQLLLTRMIDLQSLRAGRVPCAETLERALAFLRDATANGEARLAAVYPPPPAP